MGNDKKVEEQEKSFIVRDKRFSAKKEGEEKPNAIEEEKSEEKEVPLPEINFVNFLFSLSTSALIQLGEIQDPLTQKVSKNLPVAKQTIDLIGMLREKTKGNLTPEEENFLDRILYDLRMRYVKAAA